MSALLLDGKVHLGAACFNMVFYDVTIYYVLPVKGSHFVVPRSHAIFTITLEQRKLIPSATASSTRGEKKGAEEESAEEDSEDEDAMDEDTYLCAKMHLVDLAGIITSKVLRRLCISAPGSQL